MKWNANIPTKIILDGRETMKMNLVKLLQKLQQNCELSLDLIDVWLWEWFMRNLNLTKRLLKTFSYQRSVRLKIWVKLVSKDFINFEHDFVPKVYSCNTIDLFLLWSGSSRLFLFPKIKSQALWSPFENYWQINWRHCQLKTFNKVFISIWLSKGVILKEIKLGNICIYIYIYIYIYNQTHYFRDKAHSYLFLYYCACIRSISTDIHICNYQVAI